MSSKDMTLAEIKNTSKSFDDTHTVKVSGFKDGGNGRITLKSINDKLDSFITEQREFNKYVIEQFKKHGWLD